MEITLDRIVTLIAILGGALSIYLNYRKSGIDQESSRHQEILDINKVLKSENERLEKKMVETERECNERIAKVESESNNWKTKYEHLLESVQAMHNKVIK